MLKKRKNKIYLFITVIVVFGTFLFLDILQYREFIGVANAGGQCVRTDAGRVSAVIEGCVIVNGACPSCALIYTPTYAMSCAGYKQVSVTSQLGAINYAIPTTFANFKGGGTAIIPGDQFIYCGTTDAMPIFWGAPGRGAKRIQKVLDAFDFTIAGFKN